MKLNSLALRDTLERITTRSGQEVEETATIPEKRIHGKGNKNKRGKLQKNNAAELNGIPSNVGKLAMEMQPEYNT